MKLDLTNKNILITGAATGMGRASALEAAKHGANIAIVDINSEGLKEVSDKLNSMDANFKSFTMDVTSINESEKKIKSETYTDQYISIEELINKNYGEDYAEKIKLKYPNIDISSDSIKYPFVFKTEFFLRDIVDFNTDKTSYILKADVIDMNIETKDTKIFMYDKEKKINIKSIN